MPKVIALTCAIALGLYLNMVLGPLAELTAITGTPPFDMRPMGYDHTAATTLYNTLGPTGRTLYLTQQIPRDTLYPAALALWSVLTLRHLRPGTRTIWLPIAAALADYTENTLIVAMLLHSPTPALTLAASTATITKSVLTTLSLTLILWIITRHLWRKWR